MANVGGFGALWAKECAESEDHSLSCAVRDLPTLFSTSGTSRVAPIGFAGLGVPLITGGRGASRTYATGLVAGGSVVRWSGYIVDGMGGRFAAHAQSDSLEWTIEGNRLANTVQAIANPTRFPPAGPQIQLDGAALAFFVNGVVSADGEFTVAYPVDSPYHGRSHFTEFVDIPPDAVGAPSEALDRIRQAFAQAGTPFVLGTTAAGVQRRLIDCQYAGLDASGVLFLRPEDIGNQIEQIPPAVADNTVQHFRFFPNGFFRRVGYVNSIRCEYTDSIEIDATAALQPYTLRTVDLVPTDSTWLFIIDGQPHVVRLQHPEGSDFRRPDEIWNGVVVPLIQSAIGEQSYTVLLSPYIPGLLTLDRLPYLQYARMLAVGDNGVYETTDVTQTGSTPV